MHRPACFLLGIALFLPGGAALGAQSDAASPVTWARGVEGQRKADLGDGTYLNPIIAGDHPDPSILKDGRDYYMVFSTFESYPGLVLWHSRDLVNWQPIGPTLFKNVGPVWAPDLVKHEGRYYIYFPARLGNRQSNYVIWVDDIRGPWSEPVDLNVGHIDPGHAVGPDGRRYLFLSAGHRVELARDGLSIIGEPTKVYDGWEFPEDWIVAGFGLEGPKLLRHGDTYHMIVAQGGTAGPPTSHMVAAARSKSIDVPWGDVSNAGRHSRMVESQRSAPSSTSRAATVAVNDFVHEPMSNRWNSVARSSEPAFTLPATPRPRMRPWRTIPTARAGRSCAARCSSANAYRSRVPGNASMPIVLPGLGESGSRVHAIASTHAVGKKRVDDLSPVANCHRFPRSSAAGVLHREVKRGRPGFVFGQELTKDVMSRLSITISGATDTEESSFARRRG
ncbi:MAG TPA: family 43 glycosylhydrolase [Opitutaceae bacterium]